MLDRPWIDLIFSLGKYLLIYTLHSNYYRTIYDVHELHAIEYGNDKEYINIYKCHFHNGHVLQLHCAA